MALDLPDWSRQSFTGLKLLATIACPNPPGGCLQDVTITPDTRSLVFLWSAPVGSNIDVQASGKTTGIHTGHVTLYGGIAQLTQIIGSLLVDAHIEAVWTVSGSASGTGNGTLYVFGSSDAWAPYNPAVPMPIAYSDGQQYRIGQQAMLQSLPVVIASDQNSLKTLPLAPNLVSNHVWNNPSMGVGVIGTGVLVNSSYRGVVISAKVTAITGVPNLTIGIAGITADASNQFATDLLDSTAMSAVGNHVDLVLYPGIAPVANKYSNMVLPPHWALIANNSGAGSTVGFDVWADFIP